MMKRTIMIIVMCAAVTGLATAAVPWLIVSSEDRSAFFAMKIIWGEFLVMLTWAYIGLYWSVSAKITGRSGMAVRIIPGLGVITFLYVFAAGAALIGFSIIGGGDGIERAHLAVQIVMLTLYCVAALLLGIVVNAFTREKIN